MPIPFCKFHGFGNDYIVIERSAIPHGTDVSELSIAMCNRHTGVGGDGIAMNESAVAEETRQVGTMLPEEVHRFGPLGLDLQVHLVALDPDADEHLAELSGL